MDGRGDDASGERQIERGLSVVFDVVDVEESSQAGRKTRGLEFVSIERVFLDSYGLVRVIYI